MSLILVVDDREPERDLLETVLCHQGHEILQADTGEGALTVARASAPDLIIVDMMMPGMNGAEFVRELRSDPALHATRVVFCTATYDLDEVRKLAASCGVEHIVVKPCEPQDIMRIAAEALAAGNSVAHVVDDQFDREQLRMLNAKLVQKVEELEALALEQEQLHDSLRQAERATAESLTLLEVLQSSAPIGFGFVDTEFRLRRLDKTLADVHRVVTDEVLGLTVAEIAPQRWKELEPIYRRVLDEGEPVINVPLEADDPAEPGERRHWLVSYYPVRFDRMLLGVGVVAIDVTESQQADAFRSVLTENMAEGLFATDADGRLVMMNPAAARMLGWSEEELRGESVHQAFHYQHADGTAYPEEECEISHVRAAGRSVRVEKDAFTRRDGSILPVSYSAAPLLSGERLRGSVVVFRDTTAETAMEQRAQRELDSLAWVGRIRDAIDDGRLVLYSQPIVPLSPGFERAEELLLRMVGADGQVIPPGTFLPIAEKYGLIGEIDRWVITQAAGLAASGRHVHANLSAESIGSLDLLRQIELELNAAGADPANVVFEITETALMRNVDLGQAFARGINDIGCSVALDDFGTGYGSFTYLKRLTLAFLKIDIEFVRDLPTNETNRHVVNAIVGLGRGLGLKTIAEGVETEDTLELLREIGVDLAQGYHLGRPWPVTPAG
jgi:PAS domain S-box-containing protein